MRHLTEDDWSGQYRAAYERVFRSTDPFDAPLRPRNRAILFPVAFTLDREQFESLVGAARAVGDEALCVTITEGDSSEQRPDDRHWLVDFWDFTEYQGLPALGALENAIYSPEGRWGLLISHEQHAVVGGCEAFMEALVGHWPDSERGMADFLTYWDVAKAQGASTEWVRPFLIHVFGHDPREQE